MRPPDIFAPRFRLSRTLRESSGIGTASAADYLSLCLPGRLGGMQDALTEQIKFRPAIPLPLNQLEVGNLAFGLPLRPRQI